MVNPYPLRLPLLVLINAIEPVEIVAIESRYIKLAYCVQTSVAAVKTPKDNAVRLSLLNGIFFEGLLLATLI